MDLWNNRKVAVFVDMIWFKYQSDVWRMTRIPRLALTSGSTVPTSTWLYNLTSSSSYFRILDKITELWAWKANLCTCWPKIVFSMYPPFGACWVEEQWDLARPAWEDRGRRRGRRSWPDRPSCWCCWQWWWPCWLGLRPFRGGGRGGGGGG